MSYRTVRTGLLVVLLAAGLGGLGWWVLAGQPPGASKASPPPIPAKVTKPFKEADATAFTLTPEGEAAIAVQYGTVERKRVARVREYEGEIVIPPGRGIIVSAPLAGTLEIADPAKAAATAVAGPLAATLEPSPDALPVAGKVIGKGQPVLYLSPILDPIGRANLTATRVEAEGQVLSADEQLKAAEIALDRAKRVLAGGAGRQRDVDEAQALVDLATKTLAAATARRDLLRRVVGDLESGGAAPIAVEAPSDGVLRNVSALPGQAVPSGAALFEVVNLDRVWVRVPVYVGDREEIDRHAAAAVGGLTARPGDATRPAVPVTAPPTANPATGTADLFFAFDNRRWSPGAAVAGFGVFAADTDAVYGPGERVGVTITLRTPAQSLTVPWKAVVFDIHGGAWVYQPTGNRSFLRRRVMVRYVVGDTAVLAEGPDPGTKVVTAGAAELFGTETGFSK